MAIARCCGICWLAHQVSEGVPTCLFLVKSRLVRDGVRGKDPDVVAALVSAQSQCEQPIQLVPVVVAWRRGPEKLRSETLRNLLGSSDEPTVFEKLYLIVRRTRTSLLQAGEPLDLKILVEHSEDQSIQRRARIARIMLRRYLYRESMSFEVHGLARIGGCGALSCGHQKCAVVVSETERTGQSPIDVRADVSKVVDRMAARMTHSFIVGGGLL